MHILILNVESLLYFKQYEVRVTTTWSTACTHDPDLITERNSRHHENEIIALTAISLKSVEPTK